MGKLAFIFAGQGAQHTGMGKEIYEKYDAAKEVFDMSNFIFNRDIKTLCFEGSEEELSKTLNSQPSTLVYSLAILAILKEENILPQGLAGFSLGECTAMIAGDAIDFSQGMTIIDKRSKRMQEAAESSNGGMAAIIGLAIEEIENICNNIEGLVMPVNYNCSNQTVIAGEKEAVAIAATMCEAAGANKAVTLKVNAAFHTPLMHEAADNFCQDIKDISYTNPILPIYSNITAQPNQWQEDLATYLANQIKSPVLWQKTMENMIAEGYDTFVEIGPGKVLTAFMKRIDRKAKVLNTCDAISLEKTINTLKAQQ